MVDAETVADVRRRLGRSLAAYRRAAGVNQEQLAAQIGYRRSTVANVETGRQRAARPFWEGCDKALGVAGALVRGHQELEALVRDHHRARAAEEAPTNRRDVNSLLAAASMAGAVSMLDAAERVSLTGARVDRRLIASHIEIADHLAGLYRNGDPTVVVPMAITHADGLLDLLDASMGDRELRELSHIAVDIHAQIGLWACHLRRPSLAHRYLATACDLAASTRDPALHARALGAFSYLFSSAPRGGYGGKPERALALLAAALVRAQRSDNFTRGWLATWRADQHATLGNLAAARIDIDTAARALGTCDDSAGAGFFSRRHYGCGMAEHLGSVTAVALALHGQTDQADLAFNHVQRTAANMRRRIATFGHLGMVRTATNQPEAACDALRKAASLAVRERYPMGLARVHGVRQLFPARWRGHPCIKDFDDQLVSLTAH